MGISNAYIGSSTQIRDAQVTNAKLGTDIAIGGNVFLFPHLGGTVVQGTWEVLLTGGTNVFTTWCNNATGALNDEITYPVYLSAGTYKCDLLTRGNTNAGKLHLIIDTTDKGSFDMYNGSDAGNLTKTITGISVTTTGLKTIHLKLSDKNAASSGYYAFFYCLNFQRTA